MAKPGRACPFLTIFIRNINIHCGYKLNSMEYVGQQDKEINEIQSGPPMETLPHGGSP